MKCKKSGVKTMAKFKDLYPGRYLKVDDLRGGDLTLTIESFDQEQISGRFKPVVTFDTGDRLVVNATNGRILFHLLDEDTDNWAGHTITLYLYFPQFASYLSRQGEQPLGHRSNFPLGDPAA